MSSSGKRLLEVTVLEARNVLGIESSTASDTFASLKFLDIANRVIKNENAKTNVISGTLNPRWGNQPGEGENFTFGEAYDMSNPDTLPTLVVSLFDKNTFSSNTPMGCVEIPLDLVHDAGDAGTGQVWYPLQKDTREKMKGQPRGDIMLEVRFLPSHETGHHSAADLSPFHFADEDQPEQPCNELRIRIIEAKDLLVMDARSLLGGTGSSDPFVGIKVESPPEAGVKPYEAKTDVKKKTLVPIWNKEFAIPWMDDEANIDLTVMDYDEIAGVNHVNDFIGKVTIPLNRLGDHQVEGPKWYKLRNVQNKVDDKARGQLHMMLQWVFNPLVTTAAPKKGGMIDMFGDGDKTDEDDDDDDEAKDDEEEMTEEEREAQKQARADAEAALKEQVQGFEIKSGDYQIQVHVIEARELKAKDLEGTSDPVVFVEMDFGEHKLKQNTAVVDKSLSAVWDELLIFNLRNLDKEEFEQGQIRVNVMDADTLTRNDMIGSYTVDASFIYFKKDHEQYRTWVALINEEDVEDTGIQGYLKLSIQIVGPNDKLKVHDEEEDKKKEKARDRESGGSSSISGMVVMPPAMRRDVKWLVTTFWRAAYLPVMDQNVVSRNGIDAFGQIEMGAMKPFRTKVKKMQGERAHLNPMWRTELWVPIVVPTSTQTIKYSIWDYETIGPNELVAMFYDRFNVIDRLCGADPKGIRPHWVNLYGAQTGVGGTALESLQTAVKISDFDWKEFYNKFGDHAPAYRGRVLISQRMEEKQVGLDKNKKVQDAFKRKIKKLDRSDEPPATSYKLQCVAIAGTELPRFKSTSLKNLGQLSKMSLRISCGQYEILSKRQQNNNGVCEWYQLLDDGGGLEITGYPKDPAQVPDVFIHLLKGDGSTAISCSFARIPFADLLEKKFSDKPKWIKLHEDKHLDLLDNDDFPGSVLLQLGVGTDAEWDEAESSWKDSVAQMQHRTPYELRVHIFQGRHLPAADFNGMLDPFLKVNFNGLEPKRTEVIKENRDPQFFETLVFDCALPVLTFAPQVNVQVWDHDFIGDDDYMGCFFFDLNELSEEKTGGMGITEPSALERLGENGEMIASKVPDPKWYPLMREEPNDCEGQILVSFQLIPKETPDQVLPKPPPLAPECQPATIEILVMGLRDMQPYQFMPMSLPFMEFELASPKGGADTAETAPKKYPRPDNPNFLERILMQVELPKNAVFAPALKITAKDTRLGGLTTPTVGVGTIDLVNKLPWSPSYEPPNMAMVSQADIAAARGPSSPGAMAEAPDHLGGGVAESKSDGSTHTSTHTGSSSSNAQAGSKKAVGELGGSDEDKDELDENGEKVVIEKPIDFKDQIAEKKGAEDTGAGVFGALLHMDEVDDTLRGKRKSKVGFVDSLLGKDQNELENDYESEDDEEDSPPKWKVNRPFLQGDLELALKNGSPFETYELSLGTKFSSILSDADFRVTAKFKGLIRVTMGHAVPEPLFDLNTLLRPQGYKVRVYVLRAMQLAAMDMDLFGRPGKSDPYLKVTLGKDTIDKQDEHMNDTTDCDFYQLFEFNTNLPGDSQLKITCMDYDDIGSDDQIGSTVIDLEDRWFSSEWQALGKELQTNEFGKMRWAVKPVERRQLFQSSCKLAQGVVELWIDIMAPAEASAFPPDDVSLPPILEAEVRIVIWKARDVVAMDTLEDMNDLYVRCWVEGCDPQDTDVHWRAKKGKGSFNWRMKFNVDLGHSTKAMKFPYLHVQMWDQDVIKWNDIIAETMIDLGKHFKRCYYKKKEVKLFQGKGGVKKPVVPENEEVEEEPTESDALLQPEAENPMIDSAAPDPASQAKSKDSGGKDGIELTEAKSGVVPAGDHKGTDGKKAHDKKKAKKKAKPDANAGPELDAKHAEKAKQQEMHEERAEDMDADTMEFVQTFKEISGWGDTDPKDSDWLFMDKLDHETGKREPMGRVCVGITILPKSIADLNQVGSGRSEPNTKPYLPPPTGRIKFSLNPFVMGSELCGPKLCAQLSCCLMCVGLILLSIFCQPVINAALMMFCNR